MLVLRKRPETDTDGFAWYCEQCDGELWEENEIGAGRSGLVQPGEDHRPVAVEIADDGIDLGQCEPHHRLSLIAFRSSASICAMRSRSESGGSCSAWR